MFRPTNRWTWFHRENKAKLLESKGKNIQVIFYGDSITQGWMKSDNVQVFNSLFTREGGGEYEGLALGIPGDGVCL